MTSLDNSTSISILFCFVFLDRKIVKRITIDHFGRIIILLHKPYQAAGISENI